jgi:site-specific DNA-methyltransferase (adenine-specific)
MLKRLSETYGESILKEIKVDGIPQDLASARALANRKDDYVRKEFEKWAVLTYSNNRAVINEKKGADKGIDGVVYFQTGAGETERMIVQVKSGNVNRGTIATLKGDMERENAKIAVLLTLEEPTKPMLEEAYASGFYTHPLMQKDYARIKIVTARELIEENKRIEMPLSLSATRAAPRVEDNIEQINLFSDNTPN